MGLIRVPCERCGRGMMVSDNVDKKDRINKGYFCSRKKCKVN